MKGCSKVSLEILCIGIKLHQSNPDCSYVGVERDYPFTQY